MTIIDTDNMDFVERLAKAMHERTRISKWESLSGITRADARTDVRKLLEDVAAPKIVEPDGLGALVLDKNGSVYTRVFHTGVDTTRYPAWVSGGIRRNWSELNPVQVLNTGMTKQEVQHAKRAKYDF